MTDLAPLLNTALEQRSAVTLSSNYDHSMHRIDEFLKEAYRIVRYPVSARTPLWRG